MSLAAYISGGIGPGATIPQFITRGLHDATAVSAAISGTATPSLLESDVAGQSGKTVVITLTNDTWVAAGAAFEAERSGIIAGLSGDGGEALGWDNTIQLFGFDDEGLIVRTSDTVVTITLSDVNQATYDITSNEAITVTIPASALVTSSTAIVATPTFLVTAAVPVVTTPQTSAGGGRRGRVYTPVRTDRTKPIDIQSRIKPETKFKAEPKAPLETKLGDIKDSIVPEEDGLDVPLGESLRNLINFPEPEEALTPEGLRALIEGLVDGAVDVRMAEELRRQDAEKIIAALEEEMEPEQRLDPRIEELLLLLLLI